MLDRLYDEFTDFLVNLQLDLAWKIGVILPEWVLVLGLAGIVLIALAAVVIAASVLWGRVRRKPL